MKGEVSTKGSFVLPLLGATTGDILKLQIQQRHKKDKLGVFMQMGAILSRNNTELD